MTGGAEENISEETGGRPHVEQWVIDDLEAVPRSSEGDSSSSVCHDALDYFVYFLVGAYCIIMPGLSLYFGIAYYYCEDQSAPWLIVGGVLGYGNISFYLVRKFLKRFIGDKIHDWLLGMIIIVSIILLFWWVWGLSRILSGSILDDPVMEDPVCKEYMYRFPFWLTLIPFIIVFFWMIGGLCCVIVPPFILYFICNN